MTTANQNKTATTTTGTLLEVLNPEIVQVYKPDAQGTKAFTVAVRTLADKETAAIADFEHCRSVEEIAQRGLLLMAKAESAGQAVGGAWNAMIAAALHVSGKAEATFGLWCAKYHAQQEQKWKEIALCYGDALQPLFFAYQEKSLAAGMSVENVGKNFAKIVQMTVEREARAFGKLPLAKFDCLGNVAALRANGYEDAAKELEDAQKEKREAEELRAARAAVKTAENAAQKAQEKADAPDATAKQKTAAKTAAKELEKARATLAKLEPVSGADVKAAGTRSSGTDTFNVQDMLEGAREAWKAEKGALAAAAKKLEEAFNVSGLSAADKLALGKLAFVIATNRKPQLVND